MSQGIQFDSMKLRLAKHVNYRHIPKQWKTYLQFGENVFIHIMSVSLFCLSWLKADRNIYFLNKNESNLPLSYPPYPGLSSLKGNCFLLFVLWPYLLNGIELQKNSKNENQTRTISWSDTKLFNNIFFYLYFYV